MRKRRDVKYTASSRRVPQEEATTATHEDIASGRWRAHRHPDARVAGNDSTRSILRV